MSMPFYVAPEQQMKDRADFARKGIARGRSVIVLRYADGILFVAENRSQALHKVSEIYDRLGFAAVGRYNEFENLRTAGIRYADLRGYSYDRTDVTGRGLANAYAQLLGTIFSSGGEKPYEVEIVVAELGPTPETDQIYRLTYDGSVADENGYAVMGGSAEAITETVRRGYEPGMDLPSAVRLAVRSLSTDGGPNVPPRELGASALEVAILDRTRVLPRKFRRIHGSWLTGLLSDAPGASDTAPPDPGPEAPPAALPAEVPEIELGHTEE
jgi:proteasome alpha subunit